MTALCDHFSTFYRRTVRVVFALCTSWLFVSNLVFRNFIDIDEHSWLTPNTALLQGLLFVWSACCAFGIRLPAAPCRCWAGYDTLLFSARFFSLPFG